MDTSEKPQPVQEFSIKDSPALRRLIEEVKVDNDEPVTNYNRTYHRHNR